MSSATWFPLTKLTTAALVLVVAAAAVAGAAIVLQYRLESLLLKAFSSHTGGRPVRVDGRFEVHWLTPHPRISAASVVIGNPPWMPAGETAEFGQVTLLLHWQWSWLPLGIQRLELRQAQLHLLRDENGRANWYASADGAGSGPPLIGSLDMPDAHLELRDDRFNVQFRGGLSAGDALQAGAGAPPLHIEAHGEINGREASLSVEADPLALARHDRAYHFTLHARSGATRVSGAGFLAQAFDFRVLQGNFAASGPNLKQLHFLVGLTWPDTGPFHAAGTVARRNDRFQYDDLSLTTGASDVHGNLVVDSSGERSAIEGALRAKRLRLADLGPRAAPPGSDPQAASEPRLADTPLRVPGLLRTDWRVTLRADEVELGAASLQTLAGTLSARNGVLVLDGFSATLAQGKITGSARLDAAAAVPHGHLNLSAEQVQLQQLLPDAQQASPPVSGRVSGRVQLEGSGKTLREMAGASNGTAAAVLPSGEVRDALVQAASLELSGLFGRLRNSQKETNIRCAVAKLEVHEGLGTVRTLVIDTDDAVLTGDGTVNFAADSLDLSVRGRPKKPTIALHSAVHVQGSLAHPRLSVGGGGVAGQTAAAVALGVLLTPIASVLAFVNPGLAHDTDCAALTAQAVPAPAIAATVTDTRHVTAEELKN